jgi:hypothetical protein
MKPYNRTVFIVCRYVAYVETIYEDMYLRLKGVIWQL